MAAAAASQANYYHAANSQGPDGICVTKKIGVASFNPAPCSIEHLYNKKFDPDFLIPFLHYWPERKNKDAIVNS